MSEQIREQISAFLDGELPNSETELLLKRLTRDAELRESFGRYALIGEAMRGRGMVRLSRGFASRVNRAIDGEPAPAVSNPRGAHGSRWWRPLSGVAAAAGVAAIAIVALQQHAVAPVETAARSSILGATPVVAAAAAPHEALSYTVPAAAEGATPLSNARLTNYVFAHSKYSSGLGQRGVLADLLIEDEPADSSAVKPAARVVP